MPFLSLPLSHWAAVAAARLVLNPRWLQDPWVSPAHPNPGIAPCNIPFSSSYKPGSPKNIGKGTISTCACQD